MLEALIQADGEAPAGAMERVVYQAVYYVVFHLTRAVLVVLQRDSYLYWPFVLSTVLIALLVAHLARNSPHHLFDWRHWLHASARADYKLYFLGALIYPALAAWIFTDAGVAAGLARILGAGTAPALEGAALAGMRLLFTVCVFIAYDYGRYLAHWLLHEVPVLWEFHKVHHSALVLTPMTSYRLHPVDALVMGWVPALLTGLVTFLFNLAGAGISVYSLLGVHVVIWIFNLIDNLKHSDVWLTYGPDLGKWLISPAHHQLHHSLEARHWGCNRGNTLAIWDRLHGTLCVPAAVRETFRIGLEERADRRWNSVFYMLLGPFLNVLRRYMPRLRGRG